MRVGTQRIQQRSRGVFDYDYDITGSLALVKWARTQDRCIVTVGRAHVFLGSVASEMCFGDAVAVVPLMLAVGTSSMHDVMVLLYTKL